MMENKLKDIFDFLNQNREHNTMVRKLEYEKAMVGCKTPHEKIIGLLYFVFNTQSFPNIDYQKDFMIALNEDNDLSTMDAFLKRLISINSNLLKMEVCNTNGNPAKLNYEILFKCMLHQKGWGEKTAALLSKVIYDIHVNFKELSIWDDAPKSLKKDDELYIPVDAVIAYIFSKIEFNYLWDFYSINREIKNVSTGDEVFIWDDLWFWGFISQKGSGEKRTLKFNTAKLWTLQAIPKNHQNLRLLEAKVNEFINIIMRN